MLLQKSDWQHVYQGQEKHSMVRHLTQQTVKPASLSQCMGVGISQCRHKALVANHKRLTRFPWLDAEQAWLDYILVTGVKS